jgi:hypothetical protein
MNSKNRPTFIAALVLVLSSTNFSRLSNTECIRPIHLITLLTMGASLGILILLLIRRFNSQD